MSDLQPKGKREGKNGERKEMANLQPKGKREGKKGDRKEGKSPNDEKEKVVKKGKSCLLYTSPSPRDGLLSRMPSSA